MGTTTLASVDDADLAYKIACWLILMHRAYLEDEAMNGWLDGRGAGEIPRLRSPHGRR